MKRLWISLAVIAVILCSSPVLFLYLGLVLFIACISLTAHKKIVRNNKESVSVALFLNLFNLLNLFCRFIRMINFVSDVEALRLPNYLTLLLKPHPEVTYEKLQIREDSINLIIYRPKTATRNNGILVYSHGGKEKYLYFDNFRLSFELYLL